MAIIRDPFKPGRMPRVESIEQAPTVLLQQMAVSGSREAARELARRLRERRR